jgi:type IV secretory pathway VirB2 component (pilin)
MSAEKLNTNAEHELEVIDSVVRGGGEWRPEDAALTDFAFLVRNARPVPNHGEVAALDARVEAARMPRKSRQPWVMRPATAGGLSLAILVIAVGAVALSGSLNGESASLPRDAVGTAPAESTATLDPATSSVAAALGQQKGLAMQDSAGLAKAPREVARTARLTLAADGGKIETLADRVNAMTDRFGGYVAQSNVRAGEGDKGRASFLLMLPAAKYQDALASLSKLAHVRSRTQSSEDITTTVNSNERALAYSKARVAVLEAKLAKAQGPVAKASAQHSLDRAQFRMRQAARRVRADRTRVNFVPLEMTIVADKSAANAGKGTIGKAVDQAGKLLTGAVAVLIVALAVILPLALIGAASVFGYRRWRRARTNGAIAAAAAAQPESAQLE